MRILAEHFFCHIPLIHKARLVQTVLFLLRVVLKLFIEEAPTAQRIAHMHIDNTPRCQDSFLVGIFEMAEDLGNQFYASCGRFFVRRCRQFTNALTCRNKHIAVVIFCEIRKQRLGHAFGHKFSP